MRITSFCFFTVAFLLGTSCRPAAAPISVSDQPINGRSTNLPLPPSKPMTEMSWVTNDDRVQKLSDLAGKAVILDFWATYCEPCKREIPHLNSLVAKYGADNLHVVGLNVGGGEDRAKIPDFVAATRIDYPIAFPDSDLTSFIFAAESAIPQTAVFDREGRMIVKIIGFSPAIQKELDAAVELAVKSKPQDN